MFARIGTLIYNLVSTSDFLIKEFATSQIHWCSHNSMPREIAILNFKYIEYLSLFCFFFVVNFVFLWLFIEIISEKNDRCHSSQYEASD